MNNMLSLPASLSLLFCCLVCLEANPAHAQESAVETELSPFDEMDNEVCYKCHSDPELEAKTPRGKSLNLLVNRGELVDTFHEFNACVDCHRGAKSFASAPHNDGEPLTLECKFCHRSVDVTYQQSVHGQLRKENRDDAPSCADCHGRHNIFPVTDLRSSVNKFNIAKKCGSCHTASKMAAYQKRSQGDPVEENGHSVHGRALNMAGLKVAPSCPDCHGSHDILPKNHADSRINKANTSTTCGECHELVEVEYERSVHGKLLIAKDDKGPTCTECHDSHHISVLARPEFRGDIDKKCGHCHEREFDQYRETIHGKASVLGRQDVAVCSDCHGAHDILPQNHPDSNVHESNRLTTCLKCHVNANENFARIRVHAHHSDRESSPHVYYVFIAMTWALILVFIFFFLHSVLWAYRSFRSRDSVKRRLLDERIAADDVRFLRFSKLQRIVHWAVMTTFIVLLVTGLPLKYADTTWSNWLLGITHGAHLSAMIHRFAAAILVIAFWVHVCGSAVGLWRNRRFMTDQKSGRLTARSFLDYCFGPDSILPRMQDFRDLKDHLKWFVGGGKRPKFDRYTYYEKFDYFIVFISIIIVGLSGFVIWFPEMVTLFLPGWIVNVAVVVHSDEALLVVGFVLVFHLFHTHFRGSKFPMDRVMGTGWVTKTELQFERPLQLARIEEIGLSRLPSMVPPERKASNKLAGFGVVVGFVFGVIIFALILVNVISRLISS